MAVRIRSALLIWTAIFRNFFTAELGSNAAEKQKVQAEFAACHSNAVFSNLVGLC